jgi:hypothetical protein
VFARHLEGGADLDSERLGEAALEDDSTPLKLRTAGRDGHVHRRAAIQAGELNPLGTSGRSNGRQRERDGRAALGHSRQLADRDRIGLGRDKREQVCPVRLPECPLPRVVSGRADLQSKHDRRHRCRRDGNREGTREPP